MEHLLILLQIMFTYIPITTGNVLTSFIISITTILLSILIFYCCWWKHMTFYFPRGKYLSEIDNDVFGTEDRIAVDSMRKYFGLILKILLEMDAVYWCRYLGYEGKNMM